MLFGQTRGVHIGLKGHQLQAQGSALGCTMQGEARPARAKAFALTAREIQRPHKNPGRCPGLLAAAPLGRRWVFVVVRADTGGCPYGWVSATTPNPSFPKEGTTLGVRHCSGRHRGLPLRLGVTYIPYVPCVLYVFSPFVRADTGVCPYGWVCLMSRLSSMSFLCPICPVCPTKK